MEFAYKLMRLNAVRNMLKENFQIFFLCCLNCSSFHSLCDLTARQTALQPTPFKVSYTF